MISNILEFISNSPIVSIIITAIICDTIIKIVKLLTGNQ